MIKRLVIGFVLVLAFAHFDNSTATANSSVIIANGTSCTLANAIRSANADSGVGGCATGSGADRIEVQGDAVLVSAENSTYGVTGLPVISSNIHIDGNGHTIRRDVNGPELRLLSIAPSGNLTLENVTLRHGQTETSPLSDDLDRAGGAIFAAAGAQLHIIDSTLDANTAAYGGGAILGENATITLENTIVKNNLASSLDLTVDFGGGLLIIGGQLTIDDSTFTNNESSGGVSTLTAYGGAMVLFDTAATIRSSTFTNNRANSRGGAIDALDSSLNVDNTIFDNNYAGNRGSTVALFNTAFTSRRTTFANASGSFGVGLLVGVDSVADVYESTITNNIAIGTSDGGGIVVDQGTLTLQRSTVYSNTASGGAGIYLTNGTLTMVNSTVSGNTAGSDGGGGIWLFASDATLVNSTVAFNHTEWPLAAKGGGLYLSESTLNLDGSLVVGNTVTPYFLGNNGDQIFTFTRENNTTTINSRGDNLIGQLDDSGLYELGDGTLVSNILASETPAEAISAILNSSLALNGGQTVNHALAPNSPAIDNVASNDCTSTPVSTVDQRNRLRNINGSGGASSSECDSGAFEYLSTVTPTSVTLSQSGASTINMLSWLSLSLFSTLVYSTHLLLTKRLVSQIN